MQTKNRKSSSQERNQRNLLRKTSSQERNQRKALLDLAAARLVKKLIERAPKVSHSLFEVTNVKSRDEIALMHYCYEKPISIIYMLLISIEIFFQAEQRNVSPKCERVHQRGNN